MERCSEDENSTSAMKALGHLFKLIDIFIWDDGYSNDIPQQPSLPKHIRFKYDDDDDDDVDGNHSGATIKYDATNQTPEDRIIVDGEGVTEEMSSLGLPLSFQTNKQPSRGGQIKGKSKLSQHITVNSQERLDEQVEESCKLNEEKPYCADFQVKSSNSSFSALPHQSEISGCGSNVTQDTVRLSNFCERYVPSDMAADLIFDGHEEHVHDCSLVNLPAESVNDDLVRADLQKESEMMYVDDRSNLPMANTSSGSNILDDHLQDDMSLTEQLDAQGSILGSSIMQAENSDSVIIEQPQSSDLHMVVLDEEYHNSGRCWGTCGDWSAYWDTFYLKYYFYNAETKVSTWDPPPGMESFASGESCDSVVESNVGLSKTDSGHSKDQSEEVESVKYGLVDKSILNDVDKAWVDDMSRDHSQSKDPVSVATPCENNDTHCESFITAQLSNASSSTCEVEATHEDYFTNSMHIKEGDAVISDFHMMDTTAVTKQTAKRKSRRRKKSLNNSEVYQVEECCIDITKYWCQRYQLFSRFDEGIKMDEEGWFSVTPEAIARHQASRCRGGTVIDCFTGVGGNAIQFAKTSKHVVAIDIDPDKIYYAHHNASIYGVQDNIEFVLGDSLNLASKLKADTVFLSPPWGGPDYVKVKSYDIHLLQPYDGKFLFDTFKVVAPMIVMFLPRNVDIEQLAELCLSEDPPWSLEVEKNFLNRKFKAVTAYFTKNGV